MLRKVLFVVTAGCTVLGTSGCSSIMTHTGPYQGYYPGTRAGMQVLHDKDSNWCIRPLAAIDLPFSVVLDTVLLLYEYFRLDSNTDEESPRSRMLHSHQHERELHPRATKPAQAGALRPHFPCMSTKMMLSPFYFSFSAGARRTGIMIALPALMVL